MHTVGKAQYTTYAVCHRHHIIAMDPAEQQHTAGSPSITLEQLRQSLQQFAAARHWQQYHTPRNLLLALVGEVGELSEIFQWRGEVSPGLPGFTADEQQHIGEELSDVLLYLIRLADVCGIDLSRAALDKLVKNAAKYPADRCKGSSAKYTAYQERKAPEEQQQQGQQQPEVHQHQRPQHLELANSNSTSSRGTAS